MVLLHDMFIRRWLFRSLKGLPVPHQTSTTRPSADRRLHGQWHWSTIWRELTSTWQGQVASELPGLFGWSCPKKKEELNTGEFIICYREMGSECSESYQGSVWNATSFSTAGTKSTRRGCNETFVAQGITMDHLRLGSQQAIINVHAGGSIAHDLGRASEKRGFCL